MNVLVIRRDNIGDLICTLPMLATLKQHRPEVTLHVLVNSYNVPVLQGLDYIDHIHVYTKGKHRDEGQSLLAVYIQKLMTFLRLRKAGLSVAIAASGGFNRRAVSFARLAGARRIISFCEPGQSRSVTDPVALPASREHEAFRMMRLLVPLGLDLLPPPAPRLVVAPEETRAILGHMPQRTPERTLTGCHISARRPANRWTRDHWIRLIHQLYQSGHQVALFWAPGKQDDPRHPGDDDLAREIVQNCPPGSVIPVPTRHLRELIAGLALCDRLILSDGGHMHIGAALGRPMVCFFGDTDSQRWYPHGSPYELLQPESQRVKDIAPEDVMAALDRLTARTASCT
ncbi:glycosyltransferase family 9 protein [Hahella sp. SMD15-11]|uniref:Glycosyltransferase family 9 protein n=1 Tax=Thermohahella caldifontis TaxID=3142973 RepID=A0AB39UVX3_9GAMM